MNLTNYKIVKTHKNNLVPDGSKNVVRVLDEQLHVVKTFTSERSLNNCYGRARAFLTEESKKMMEDKLTCPIGSFFSLKIQETSQAIEKISENTFEIFNKKMQSATVDGDLLINILYGKENINNLKFI